MKVTVDTEDYVIDAIGLIGQYLAEKGIARGNPADNTGAEYENDVFLISAYDWRDDLPEEEMVPNFWFKPLNYQVEWYKHIGRGTFSNRPMDIDTTMDMLNKCIVSLEGAAVLQAPEDDDFWEYEEPDEE